MLRVFKQYYPIRNILFVIGEGSDHLPWGDDFLFTDIEH
jgi:hypothetical protein